MVGAKTNERPGTRAQVRYVRMSASKARVVLNLIRGKHVAEASQILAFNERLASEVIGKALRSAVANAGHNDEIPPEELYVSACYADEGPTLKRFRPRARGRAGRIHKQTCHITVIVSRYSDDELDELRRRAELKGSSSSGDASAERRRRVAKSRAADADADQADDADLDDDAPADETTDTDVTDDVETDDVAGDDVDTDDADDAADDADDAADEADDAADDAPADEVEAEGDDAEAKKEAE